MSMILRLINECLSMTGGASVDLRGTMIAPCPFCHSANSAKSPHTSVFKFPGTGEPGVKVFGENCTCAGRAMNAMDIIEHFFGVTQPKDKVMKLKEVCERARIDPAVFGLKSEPPPAEKPKRVYPSRAKSEKEKIIGALSQKLAAQVGDAAARQLVEDYKRADAAKNANGYIPTDFARVTICAGGVRDTKHCESVTLLSLLRDIKGGKWRETVERVRACSVKADRDRIKNTALPTVAPWGVYKERNAEGLASLSGFIVVDFDGKDNPGKDAVELRGYLAQLPFCAGAFLSPSGNGVKALLRANPELDRDGNAHLAQRILAPQGWKMDAQGSQWFQASYDPDAFITSAQLQKVMPMREIGDCDIATLTAIFLPKLEKYWFCGSGGFIKRNRADEWQTMNTSEFKEDMQIAGVPDRKRIIALTVWLRENRFVARVENALSAHKAGVYDTPAGRMIVRSSPNIPVPVRGKWDTIKSIIEAMFNDPENPIQIDTVYAHLARCYTNFSARVERGIFEGNQPYFGIIGEPDCGKSSLFLSSIVTPLLGGRASDAKDSLMTDTKFNDEISGSEVLLIDDAAPAQREMLNAFAANVKRYCYARSLKMEGKGKDSWTISRFFFAIFQAMNSEGECVSAAPTLTDDIRDKVCFYYAKRYSPLPQCPDGEDANAFKQKISNKIASEIPAFAYYLQNEFLPEERVLPDNAMDRNGFKCYIHPECAKRILEESLATQFLAALDETCSRAPEFYDAEHTALAIAAKAGYDRMTSSKVGRVLTQLAKEVPDRCVKIVKNTGNFYIVKRPPTS